MSQTNRFLLGLCIITWASTGPLHSISVGVRVINLGVPIQGPHSTPKAVPLHDCSLHFSSCNKAAYQLVPLSLFTE